MNGAKVILLRRLCVFKIAIGEARRALLLRLLNVSDRARKQNTRGADLAQDVSFIILSFFMISALWKLDIVPEWEGLCFHREGVEYCFGSGAECVSQPSWSQTRFCIKYQTQNPSLMKKRECRVACGRGFALKERQYVLARCCKFRISKRAGNCYPFRLTVWKIWNQNRWRISWL